MAGARILLIGLFCAISACAPQTHEKLGTVRNYNASFACDDGQQMLVHFTPFAATIEAQGRSVDLTQQPATDRFLYSGGGQSLSAQGAEATWTDAKGAAHHCTEQH